MVTTSIQDILTASTEDSLVISKQRVTDYGEVLTGTREVNAMLDLVKQETERIDSRFLEPACGNGNFLTEILERKLRVIGFRYGKGQSDFELNAVVAVASLYGIDKLSDNVVECRARLFAIFDRRYTARFKKSARDKCRDAVRYILGCNIIHGDAISLKAVGESKKPIVFSEWSPVPGNRLKRRDYTFLELLREDEGSQQNLFLKDEPSDLGEQSFIPKEIKSWPLKHFLKVREHDE